MSLSEEKMQEVMASVPSDANLYEYARAIEAAVREEQSGEIADPLDTKLPCDIEFINGKIGKGCALRTLQLRIKAHGTALSEEIAQLREANAELLEGLRQIAGWNTDNAAVRIARALIAKHGGK